MSKKRKSRKQLKRELESSIDSRNASIIEIVCLRRRIAELEAERGVVLDYSYLGEGEPPPGITRHVLGELYPFRSLTEDK